MEKSSSQKRLLMAIALSFALTAIYVWLSPKPPPPEPGADGGVVAKADGGTPAHAPEQPPLVAATPDGGTPKVAATPPPAPGGLPVRTVTHDEAEVHYALTTSGAGLTQAALQGEKMREQRPLNVQQGYKLLFGGEVPDAPQMDMGRNPTMFPPALAVGIRGDAVLSPWMQWELDDEDTTDGEVVFTTRFGPWEAVKTLRWVDAGAPASPAARGFELAMTVALTNHSSQALKGELGVHYSRGVEAGTEEKASLLGGVGNESKASCRVNEDLFQLVPEQSVAKSEDLFGELSFIGVDQQYFLGAVFPLDGQSKGRCELWAAPAGRAAVGYFPLEVGPGQTVTRKFGVFIGPKDTDLLKLEPTAEMAAALGATLPAGHSANLLSTVNFGIWEFLCVILLAILKFFHVLVGNWGLSIVLLTLTVKVALLPLTWKQLLSAENMKKLQPKVDEIRKKFEGDRERINMEMMKVYQEAKVNPLSGCFPVLIQMPVWIALFTTLRNSYEIYREPFINPVWTDLTYKDPTYLFPVLLGVTWIVTQKLQPAMLDSAQQKLMTWVMPVTFTVMMLAYPAGLTLYIFTNNLVSIGQQYGIRKYMERKGLSAPPRPAPPGKDKDKDKDKKKGARKVESGA